MGLVGYLIKKGVQRATIKAVGRTTADVISAKTNAETEKIDAETRKILAETQRLRAERKEIEETNGNQVRISPPRDSEAYYKTDAIAAVREFLSFGFENISLKADRTLGVGSKKYGLIQSISINGNDEFSSKKTMLPNAHIIITYFDFKKEVNAYTYAYVDRIIPGVIHKAEDIRVIPRPVTCNPMRGPTYYQQPAPSAYYNAPVMPVSYNGTGAPVSYNAPVVTANYISSERPVGNAATVGSKKYCAYCGKSISSPNARFCMVCGKPIT